MICCLPPPECCRQLIANRLTRYTNLVRTFSLLFVFIALVLLAQFLIYVFRGPVDPVIAGVMFFGFLACLAPALYLLKPYKRPEQRREREEKERRREPSEEDRPG